MSEKSLKDFFEGMPDPRAERRCEHRPVGIIVIAICAMLAEQARICLRGADRNPYLSLLL